MAFIEDDDKLLDGQEKQNQGQPDGGDSSVVQGGQVSLGGPQSSLVNSGPSTAGVGAGGTGGWTNIQAYMDANKNDSGAADLLKNKVGNTFDDDRNKIKSESDTLKSDAQKASDGVKDVYSNVGNVINEGGNGYYDWGNTYGSGKPSQYKGGISQSYDETVNNVRNALNSSYSGPRDYTASLSDQSNQYGQTLGNNDAFNQFMGDVYQEHGGGNLSSGGRALQKQLHTSNEALANMRQNLLSQYTGLKDYRDQTVQDTTNALSQAEQDYRTHQNALRDYLTSTASGLDSSISQKEAAARAEYDNTFNTGKSGLSSVGYGAVGAAPTDRRFGIQEQGAGVYGDNLSWSDLQRASDFYEPIRAQYGDRWDYTPGVDQRNEALKSFYTQQDSKYGNVADPEERKWNMIQDFLGSNAERKKQGFNVRPERDSAATDEYKKALEFLQAGGASPDKAKTLNPVIDDNPLLY